MTLEEFDNYKFGVKTEVEFWKIGGFHRIVSVDFKRREIEISLGILYYDQVKTIRESK